MKSKTLAVLTLCAASIPAAELPVRTVVLYKHGVGYFERTGTLGPGESARLDFKAEEMNDVLKSLTVNQQGGNVTGLRYDSSIPLSQKLTEFPFEVENGSPLSAILDQFKGSRIEMEFGAQKISGSVVSARVIAARSKDRRSVYIDSSDAKSREVRASYITPMPAWKSSYRLSFEGAGGEPTLEGWAIVDNTTGEDWTNVKLSLVSGKPISFISQLYAPKFITRLGAELAEGNPVAPTVYTGALTAPKAVPPPPVQMAKRAGVAGGALGGSGGGGGIGPGYTRTDGLSLAPSAGLQMAEQFGVSSIQQPGLATEIADLFQYNISAPVTVKKDESAMMPFLQQKINARKLIIYSDSSKPNPFSAAELTNSTGKTLDGGPITVYDAGAYAGEALVETIKNSDKRFISYGVDLGTRISASLNSRDEGVREIHAHNGLLISKTAQLEKKTFAIHNVDARAKTLIIEYPVRSGYDLIDTAKPAETARDVYRFEVKLPASASLDFPVSAERVYDTQLTVSSLNPNDLLVYVRNRNVSDTARRLLQQIADMKTQIAGMDTDKRAATDEINNLTRDEERNRQNITSLSNVSGQQQVVQDYARRLTEQETQIAKLRDRAGALDQQRVRLQTELNGLIEKLDF